MDEFLKDLDILSILEVISRQHIDLVHEILLPLWHRALRSLQILAKCLR